MKTAKLIYVAAGALLLIACAGTRAGSRSHEQTLQTLRVVGLPGRPLPLVAAEANGLFAKYGVEVQFQSAESSDVLRASLANGKADIAVAAVDNAVALAETGGADVIIAMGGERTVNELFVQPEIHSISELRGKTLVVDAVHTAYALQLKKILLMNEMQAGRDYQVKPIGASPLRLAAMREHKEYAGTMLGPPWSVLARRDGFVSLGSTLKFIGPYQGSGTFVLRGWAREHSELLVSYLAACIEAQRWILAPTNKQRVIELLIQEAKLPPAAAEEMYALSTQSAGGYAEDARLDLEGFTNVLKLRAEIEGQWRGQPPALGKYYDPEYYEKALLQSAPL